MRFACLLLLAGVPQVGRTLGTPPAERAAAVSAGALLRTLASAFPVDEAGRDPAEQATREAARRLHAASGSALGPRARIRRERAVVRVDEPLAPGPADGRSPR